MHTPAFIPFDGRHHAPTGHWASASGAVVSHRSPTSRWRVSSQTPLLQKSADAARSAEEVRRYQPIIDASLRRLEQEATLLKKTLRQGP